MEQTSRCGGSSICLMTNTPDAGRDRGPERRLASLPFLLVPCVKSLSCLISPEYNPLVPSIPACVCVCIGVWGWFYSRYMVVWRVGRDLDSNLPLRSTPSEPRSSKFWTFLGFCRVNWFTSCHFPDNRCLDFPWSHCFHLLYSNLLKCTKIFYPLLSFILVLFILWDYYYFFLLILGAKVGRSRMVLNACVYMVVYLAAWQKKNMLDVLLALYSMSQTAKPILIRGS